MSALWRREASSGLEPSRSHLERETAALLAERRALEGGYSQGTEQPLVRPASSEIAGITPVVQRAERQQTEEVVARLQEIIRLCREEGSLSHEEMREVVKVENEVLRYLQRGDQEHPKRPEPQQQQQLPLKPKEPLQTQT